MATNYQVTVNFNDGTYDYNLPHVFHVNDPVPGGKDTIIEGTRGDGSLLIPGGKKSPEIRVRGNLFEDDYKDLTDAINEMRLKVTRNTATLTLRHKEGVTTVVDWQYTVRRTENIEFSQSLRTGLQEYEINFLVLVP